MELNKTSFEHSRVNEARRRLTLVSEKLSFYFYVIYREIELKGISIIFINIKEIIYASYRC